MVAVAERTKRASKIVRSINTPATDSNIATIGERTNTAAAQAKRDDGLKTGNGTNFSGQYLYDRLVFNDDAEFTKLDIVRQMVKALDVASFKRSIGEMVDIARIAMNRAVQDHKEANDGQYDEKNPPATVLAANARYKTAQNHQTVLRIAYGALKFAEDVLKQSGYTDKTGYHQMRVIGKKALETKGIKWDGTKAEPQEDRQARRETENEARILSSVMKDNPMKPKESRADYFSRMDKEVSKIKAQQEEEAKQERVKQMVDRLREQAGDLLPQVLDMLLSKESEGAPALKH